MLFVHTTIDIDTKLVHSSNDFVSKMFKQTLAVYHALVSIIEISSVYG